MARKSRAAQRATAHADFAGPDAEKEAIESLSKAAAKANAKAGHNSGEVPDEVVQRHITLVEAAHKEWQEKRDEAATAQGIYRNRLKVAKNDGVNKDDLIEAFKVKGITSGEYVSSRRNVGRYLRLMGAAVAEPKGGQGVFDFLDAQPDGSQPVAMEAELQGQHAYSNSEPLTNNPFKPGTQEHVDWAHGWAQAQTAKVRGMGTGNGTAEAPAH
jgi:hypothetical protein